MKLNDIRLASELRVGDRVILTDRTVGRIIGLGGGVDLIRRDGVTFSPPFVVLYLHNESTGARYQNRLTPTARVQLARRVVSSPAMAQSTAAAAKGGAA